MNTMKGLGRSLDICGGENQENEPANITVRNRKKITRVKDTLLEGQEEETLSSTDKGNNSTVIGSNNTPCRQSKSSHQSLKKVIGGNQLVEDILLSCPTLSREYRYKVNVSKIYKTLMSGVPYVTCFATSLTEADRRFYKVALQLEQIKKNVKENDWILNKPHLSITVLRIASKLSSFCQGWEVSTDAALHSYTIYTTAGLLLRQWILNLDLKSVSAMFDKLQLPMDRLSRVNGIEFDKTANIHHNGNDERDRKLSYVIYISLVYAILSTCVIEGFYHDSIEPLVTLLPDFYMSIYRGLKCPYRLENDVQSKECCCSALVPGKFDYSGTDMFQKPISELNTLPKSTAEIVVRDVAFVGELMDIALDRHLVHLTSTVLIDSVTRALGIHNFCGFACEALFEVLLLSDHFCSFKPSVMAHSIINAICYHRIDEIRHEYKLKFGVTLRDEEIGCKNVVTFLRLWRLLPITPGRLHCLQLIKKSFATIERSALSVLQDLSAS